MRLNSLVLFGLIGIFTTGCSTLPMAGPTAGQVIKGQASSDVDFKIVDLNAQALTEYMMPAASVGASLSSLAINQPVDRLGPGDVLEVTIFEIGTRLFGAAAASAGSGSEIEAQSRALGLLAVQGDGSVTLPYVGKIQVGGRTVQEVERLIVSGLRSQSQFPQVMVALKQNVTNTVIVSGDIDKPGRYPLSVARERILDVLAGAGWSRTAPDDLIVRVTRNQSSVEQRLSSIDPKGADNLTLNPADRLELIKRPRTYVVFGATQKVTQVDFNAEGVSLAEAVARAGGPDDGKANPAAVFLFRFEPPAAVGEQETPVVFRLNMLKPSSYLLSQKFPVRDKDVIYFATADANQPSKLAQIVSQLFTPLILLRTLGN